jgi:hypothetical protein
MVAVPAPVYYRRRLADEATWGDTSSVCWHSSWAGRHH